jgi:hypothetical protein
VQTFRLFSAIRLEYPNCVLAALQVVQSMSVYRTPDIPQVPAMINGCGNAAVLVANVI